MGRPSATCTRRITSSSGIRATPGGSCDAEAPRLAAVERAEHAGTFGIDEPVHDGAPLGRRHLPSSGMRRITL